jgi:hypothetical protein
MVTSNSLLYGLRRRRAAVPTTAARPTPSAVQIAGADPAMLAEAARFNVDQGAQIIDINMGCPAKKVCNVMAGSAADAGRAAGRSHPRARSRAGGAGGAGHAQVPHRLGPRAPQRADASPASPRSRDRG